MGGRDGGREASVKDAVLPVLVIFSEYIIGPPRSIVFHHAAVISSNVNLPKFAVSCEQRGRGGG